MKLEPGDIISEGNHYFVFHENPELNEQEKDAVSVQVSTLVLSCVLAGKIDTVKLKILGIVFDSALDFAKRLEKESGNGISK